MNVAMWYDACIETFDTRADGSAAATKAALEVRTRERIVSLVLWANLTYGSYDPSGNSVAEEREERGVPVEVAAIDTDWALGRLDDAGLPASMIRRAGTLQGFLDLLGAVGSVDSRGTVRRFLRCDVDGATVWEMDGEDKERQ